MVHNGQWQWVWIPCNIIRCFQVWFGWFVGFFWFGGDFFGVGIGDFVCFSQFSFLISCSLGFPAPPIPLYKLALS